MRWLGIAAAVCLGDLVRAFQAGASRHRARSGPVRMADPDIEKPKTYGELVEELADLQPWELPARLQAEALVSTVGTPQFFMAIADLTDRAQSEPEKQRLKTFAENLANTLAAIIDQAEVHLEDATQRLQEIVVACAEDDGEFMWPLSPEKGAALEKKISEDIQKGKFDEAVLTTLESWAKKASDDQMNGMVAILQKVLQLYGAHVLRFDEAAIAKHMARAAPPPEGTPEDEVSAQLKAAGAVYQDCIAVSREMNQDADEWNTILKAALQPSGDKPATVEKQDLLTIIQTQVERTVLQQPNGSVTQRVLAEYISELMNRVEMNAPKSDKPPEQPTVSDILGI